MSETSRVSQTYAVSIWLAGSVADATRICRQFCKEVGLCVTVTPTDFVYSGGAESGVLVRMVNYPRFPAQADEINKKAFDLARVLRDGLSQWSVMIETPTDTTWLTVRDIRENG